MFFSMPRSLYLYLILFAALILRLASAAGELGLDEMWSLMLLSSVSSIKEIFWGINHDNNHYLNSVWLYLVGFGQHPILYRAPSIICGMLTVLCCARLGFLQNKATGYITLLFCATSYLLVLYSSEARGYALMLMCIPIAFYCLTQASSPRRMGTQIGFYLATFGALLGHITAVQLLAGFVAYSLVRGYRQRSASFVSHSLLYLHGPIIICCALFAYFVFPELELGGGPQIPSPEVVVNALTMLLGIGEMSALNVPLGALLFLVAIALFVLFIIACAAEWRSNPAEAAFFTVMVLIVPLGLAFVIEPPVFFVRYLLPSLLCMYLLLGRYLGRLYAQSKAKRIFVSVACLLICAGQGISLVPLLTYGRGQLGQLLKEAQNISRGLEVRIDGEPQFRSELIVQYWALFGGQPVIFVHGAESGASSPSFFLKQSQDRWESFPPTISQNGVQYLLIDSRGAAPLSGIRFGLYSAKIPGSDAVSPSNLAVNSKHQQ